MNPSTMDEPLEAPCTHSRVYRVAGNPTLFCDLCDEILGDNFPVTGIFRHERIAGMAYEVAEQPTVPPWPQTLRRLAVAMIGMLALAVIIGLLARNFQ